MKIKTSELIGPALDWAVAKCEGFSEEGLRRIVNGINIIPCEYSTDWSLSGPLIERECIACMSHGDCSVAPKNPEYWEASIVDTDELFRHFGPTPLVAAMRCYVDVKLGYEVEIPEELL